MLGASLCQTSVIMSPLGSQECCNSKEWLSQTMLFPWRGAIHGYRQLLRSQHHSPWVLHSHRTVIDAARERLIETSRAFVPPGGRSLRNHSS